jgi:hypothetical protein
MSSVTRPSEWDICSAVIKMECAEAPAFLDYRHDGLICYLVGEADQRRLTLDALNALTEAFITAYGRFGISPSYERVMPLLKVVCADYADAA